MVLHIGDVRRFISAASLIGGFCTTFPGFVRSSPSADAIDEKTLDHDKLNESPEVVALSLEEAWRFAIENSPELHVFQAKIRESEASLQDNPRGELEEIASSIAKAAPRTQP